MRVVLASSVHVQGWRGAAKSVAFGACSTTLPRYITSTSSTISSTTAKSCEMNTQATCVWSCRSVNRFSTWAWIDPSSADTGSSVLMTSGSSSAWPISCAGSVSRTGSGTPSAPAGAGASSGARRPASRRRHRSATTHGSAARSSSAGAPACSCRSPTRRPPRASCPRRARTTRRRARGTMMGAGFESSENSRHRRAIQARAALVLGVGEEANRSP